MFLRNLQLSGLSLAIASGCALAAVPTETGSVTVPVADFTSCPKPNWPSGSLMMEHAGTVTLKFLIAADGKVVDAAIIRSSGYELLDKAAVDGIRKCTFKPASRNGKAEKAWMTMQYVWTFENSGPGLIVDIDQLREQAVKGDVDAIYKLGNAYRTIHTPETLKMAARLYLTAAQKDHPAATYKLAKVYRYGHGAPEDRSLAKSYLLLAAHLGSEEAQAELGLMYRDGTELDPKDLALALSWLKKAAEKGNPDAQRELGEMYLVGEGVPRNPIEAMKWLRLAANSGSAEGQLRYGMALADHGADRDLKAATVWLRKAANQRDPVAEGRLGLMYLTGEGVAVDTAEGLKLLDRAAYASQTKFQVMLAYFHEKGIHTPVDRKKANTLYRRAADLDDPVGMKNVGYSYEMGYEVPRDYAAAMTWYRQAAEMEEGSAMAAIGNLYEKGLGVEKNVATALKWYTDAASRSNGDGMRALGSLYENGIGVEKNLATALKWYGKSATQGDAVAMRRLGAAHIKGELGLRVNADLGKQWLKTADIREQTYFTPEGFQPPPVQ